MLQTKYQGFTANDFRQEVLSFLQGLAISDFTNIDKEKLVTPPGSSMGSSIAPKIVNEYDQEIPQSQTADNPVAP